MDRTAKPHMDYPFLLSAVLLTLLEAFALGIGLRYRRRIVIAVPILARSALVAMQLIGVWYCIITGRYYLGLAGHPLQWWTLGIQLEIVFQACFFAAFLIAVTFPHHRDQYNKPWEQLSRAGEGGHLVWLLWFLGLCGYLLSRRFMGTYGQDSADILLDPGTSNLRILNIILPFASLFWPCSAGLLAMSLSPHDHDEHNTHTRFFRFVVVPIIIVLLVIVATEGQRTAFVEPIIMLGVGFVVSGKPIKPLVIPAIALVMAVFASSLIFETYRADRQVLAGDVRSRITDLRATAESGLGDASYLQSSIESIVIRADLYRNAGVLAMYARERGFAGLKPYEGLLFVWLPRFIMPDKPVVGSDDGTAWGLPAYILGWWRAGNRLFLGSSASRSVAGEAYWQWGMFGVVTMGLFAGLWTAYCARIYLRTDPVLGLPLYLYLDPGGTIVTIVYYRDPSALLADIRFLRYCPSPIAPSKAGSIVHSHRGVPKNENSIAE